MNNNMNAFFSADEPDAEARVIAVMHETRLRHDRFIEELKKEDLATFIEILQCMSNEDTGLSYVHFLVGSSTMCMRLKHKSCSCGEDHMNIAHLDETAKQMDIDSAKQVDLDFVMKPVDQETLDQDALMKEYQMVIKDGQLQCAHCGHPSISMDDRMLRQPGPDGCSNCKIKSAFG